MSKLNLLQKLRTEPTDDDPIADADLINDGYATLIEMSSAFSKALDTISVFEIVKAGRLRSLKQGIDFYAEVQRFEITLIQYALVQARGSQKRAANLLGLKPTTLNSKIKGYNLDWKTIRQVGPGLAVHDAP